AEPTIVNTKSAYKNPDFVIVGADLGVVVLEIKDWNHIVGIKKKEVTIKRTNGEVVIEKNPLLIAREYTLNLVDRFQEISDLMHVHNGRNALKFPWMYAAVLPHAHKDFITKCEDAGLWDRGEVFCEEDLTPETFENALRNLPRRWKLHEPLRNNTLDAIRGAIDPEIIVKNLEEKPIGVLTVAQEKFIREPIKSLNNQPNANGIVQTSLPLDILSAETIQIAENTNIRLIRGVAGSGKSLVLARRAQFLAEQNPEWSILVLAFNVDLVGDLKHRIPGAPNLEVINFHKLCAEIFGKDWHSPSDLQGWLTARLGIVLAQNNFTAEFIASEIEWRKEFGIIDNSEYLKALRKGRGSRLSSDCRNVVNEIFDQYSSAKELDGLFDWSDVPFQTLSRLQNEHPLQHSYDAILIDEAQDFAPSWLKVIKELLKPDGLLFMCDDPTQSIFQSYTWKEKGIQVQGRTRHLRVPFRSTREISLAAHSVISENNQANQVDEILRPDFDTYELLSGDIPKLFRLRDLVGEIKFVEESVLNAITSGTTANQIAILCITKKWLINGHTYGQKEYMWAHLK
ncbi:MAG: ATP-dependent helicase, partial [Parachlamydiaceae bacterium]|nr:ATP-dependent helicase [Parachlamydiaceae bacterium]